MLIENRESGVVHKGFRLLQKEPKKSLKKTLGFNWCDCIELVLTVLNWFFVCVEVLVKYKDLTVLPCFFLCADTLE